MLFDLRGRGRRRTVQVIYLGLALLMGGGLVLFGIGGNTNGGLFDALSGNGGGSDNSAIEKQVESAEKRVKANRSDAAAWAQLAQSKYQLAIVSDGYDETQGTFSGDSRKLALDATRAWDTHLKLAGKKPDAEAAAILTRAFIALNQPEKAVRTQEIVLDSLSNPGFGDYKLLAQYAYLAGQVRKGDLATQKAIADAKEEGLPKDRRDELQAELDQFKQQAAQQAAQEATQGAGGAAAPPASP